jgi:hypothetical protein
VIAINASKLAASIKSLKDVRKKVADTADGIYRQKLYWVMEQAVRVSPQWSGEFASNWAFAIDGDMPVFRPWPGKYESRLARHDDAHTGAAAYRVTPHQAGDPEAVGVALARAASRLKGVTLKSRVHLVNSTHLEVGGEGQTMIGPDGVERLRPENVIPGHVRIETYLRARAADIPSNLKSPEAL